MVKQGKVSSWRCIYVFAVCLCVWCNECQSLTRIMIPWALSTFEVLSTMISCAPPFSLMHSASRGHYSGRCHEAPVPWSLIWPPGLGVETHHDTPKDVGPVFKVIFLGLPEFREFPGMEKSFDWPGHAFPSYETGHLWYFNALNLVWWSNLKTRRPQCWCDFYVYVPLGCLKPSNPRFLLFIHQLIPGVPLRHDFLKVVIMTGHNHQM